MSTSKKLIEEHTPYELEDLRDKLSHKKDTAAFKMLYNKKLPKITNPNTEKLWNEKFFFQETVDFQDRMTQEKIAFIAKEVSKLKPIVKLLDIGIGQAYVEQELVKRNTPFELYSIDISRLSIKRAKDKYHATGFVDDALNIDKHFKPKFFDVIIAIEVIEHISPDKIFLLYKKVHRQLKNDGLFIISTPLNEGLRYMKENPSAHVREYTKSILKAEFEISGFRIIAIKEFYAFRRMYLLKKILSNIFPNRWKPNNIIIVARKA